MVTQPTNKKIFGNVSTETHRQMNIIKASYRFKSLEETLRFLQEMFKSADKSEIRSYIKNRNKVLEFERKARLEKKIKALNI